jgi:H+/Cl- antiporter ClcA
VPRHVAVDLREQAGLLVQGAHDALLGAIVGVIAGGGSAAFLHSLDWATDTRLRIGWLRLLLPVAGLLLGVVLVRAGRSAGGIAVVLDEHHAPTRDGVPFTMGPLALAAATVTHLFGGSGGREGAAVNIAAGLSAPLRRLGALVDDRVLVTAAIAGGFGSVFGVPAAGAVFALEVGTKGLLRSRGVVAALFASVIGDRVAQGLGIEHPTLRAFPSIEPSVPMLGRLAVLAAAFGLLALVYIETTHAVRSLLHRLTHRLELRLAIGGLVVVALTTVVRSTDYLGLSLPLIDLALAGGSVAALAFAAKLVFTAVTIGAGFPGGEVTPLFCMGACLGATLAGPVGVDPYIAVALGYVAVFAAASHTPLACAVLAVELFGGEAILPFLGVNLVAGAVLGTRSVYGRQRVDAEVLSRLVPFAAPLRTGRPSDVMRADHRPGEPALQVLLPAVTMGELDADRRAVRRPRQG